MHILIRLYYWIDGCWYFSIPSIINEWKIYNVWFKTLNHIRVWKPNRCMKMPKTCLKVQPATINGCFLINSFFFKRIGILISDGNNVVRNIICGLGGNTYQYFQVIDIYDCIFLFSFLTSSWKYFSQQKMKESQPVWHQTSNFYGMFSITSYNY